MLGAEELQLGRLLGELREGATAACGGVMGLPALDGDSGARLRALAGQAAGGWGRTLCWARCGMRWQLLPLSLGCILVGTVRMSGGGGTIAVMTRGRVHCSEVQQ